MKTYLEHLMESDREYHYRIKTIEPLEDYLVEKLERVLIKYDLRSLVGPTKTIIQEHPLDFYDISNAEVYIVDVVLGIPQSSYILQQEIRSNLHIPEKYIVVRAANEPLEVETQRQIMNKKIKDDAKEKGLTRGSLLSTDEDYAEADHSISGDTFYGDEYNSEFLQTLAQVSATRSDGIVEPKNGLFNWLHNEVGDDTQIADDSDFNKDIEGAPKSVPWWKAKNTDVEDEELEQMRSSQGNFDNDHEEKHIEFKDDKNTRKTISAKSSKVRK